MFPISVAILAIKKKPSREKNRDHYWLGKPFMTDEKIFATPRKVEDVADCYFYHTMELPGHGVIEGREWDLRGRVDE
jgi:SAM-dependent methyltransferase